MGSDLGTMVVQDGDIHGKCDFTKTIASHMLSMQQTQMIETTSEPVTALLLAGRRPGVDPLAEAYNVSDKVLIKIAGEAMLSRVAKTLVSHPRIAKVIVVAQDPDALIKNDQTRWMGVNHKISTIAGPSSVSAAVEQGLAEEGGPLLVTTADNVLLTHAMIDHFIDLSRGFDVTAAAVERQVLLMAYPDSQRTWLTFKNGAWSGANLFWLGGIQAKPLLELWRGIEQDRKKGWKIIASFGPVLLIGALLRLITGPEAVERAGRKLGLKTALVPMPQAEACIDVDKISDVEQVEAILAARKV